MSDKRKYRTRVWPHGLITAVAEQLECSPSHVCEALASDSNKRTESAVRARKLGRRAASLMKRSPRLTARQAVLKCVLTSALNTQD